MPTPLRNVCSQGQSRKHMLAWSFSDFDPTETLAVHCGNVFDTDFRPLSKHSIKPIRCCLLSLGADMRRREVLGVIGGAAAWPLSARAQQQPRLPTVGLLVPGTPESHGKWVAAFVQRLSEL